MMNAKKEIELAQDGARLIEIALDVLDVLCSEEINHPPAERRMHAEVEQALHKALDIMCYDASEEDYQRMINQYGCSPTM